MDLLAKIKTIPTSPGCYLYKNAEGEVIYVGKAKNLRSRVRSYFLEANQRNNQKTGSLMREAVDIEYITVANEREALALENNLIKQRKPRFNILLRDDKTYPYIKLTLNERYPKVFVTRRLRKDGGAYFGPYFPGNLAYRLVDLIHRSFLVPSCKVDLSRYHPRACLQYYIKRCLGPCVEGFVSVEQYRETVRDVQMFLDGRTEELERKLTRRMEQAAEEMQFEAAARLRDQVVTVHQMQDKQRIATAENEDADVFGFHYENDMLAVNLFHMRGGKIVDRRDFFWEDLPEFLEASLNEGASNEEVADEVSAAGIEPNPAVTAPQVIETPETTELGGMTELGASFSPGAFFSALLKQLYLDQPYVPKSIYVPVDFEDRAVLADLLSERTKHRIELAAPQRGEKRSLVDLVCQNAKQSYDQRFRVLAPSQKAIQEALQDALMLEELPKRIECFDISHIQGAETVASMVVWEDGEEKKPFPSLVLIDGGLGQLSAAYAALEAIGVTLQPLASIAKKEEIIYVHGQEDEPVVLDRRSPVLHLMQKIRDESHRFAVTYHRKRRQIRDKVSELDAIPGVGPRTRQRLVEHFGSVRGIKQASPDALRAVVNQATAEKIRRHFGGETEAGETGTLVQIG
jgi:excinuclease ABC subunit C